ncbi:oogenesis-related [Genypterus blacodes]|uniref:oogenesis-related n=1 Tax=Genypterus blacodes TaxID=154954 RepID=UPI003F776BDB
MTTDASSLSVEEPQEQQPLNAEDQLVRSDGVLRSVIFWPFRLVVRAYRGIWLMLGFPRQSNGPAVTTPARQNLAGRKRLHRVTRVLLSVLPRYVQSLLGYPVSSNIGLALSPEVRISPTKPCGKGSKRKQDELDDDEDEEQHHQSWVEALNQELADEGPEEDPDYEPSSVETESEEYQSHNNTESDIEVHEKGMVIIEDVNMETLPIQAS